MERPELAQGAPLAVDHRFARVVVCDIDPPPLAWVNPAGFAFNARQAGNRGVMWVMELHLLR
jgi:hypothetical protein